MSPLDLLYWAGAVFVVGLALAFLYGVVQGVRGARPSEPEKVAPTLRALDQDVPYAQALMLQMVSARTGLTKTQIMDLPVETYFDLCKQIGREFETAAKMSGEKS